MHLKWERLTSPDAGKQGTVRVEQTHCHRTRFVIMHIMYFELKCLGDLESCEFSKIIAQKSERFIFSD